MLVCILYLGYYAGTLVNDGYFTSDLLKISSIEIPAEVQWWLFIGFALSFAIKVPLFPLHTWLPDAHVQAPTAGSVILAAVLLKMGTYGLVRFCLPLFPDASLEFAPIMCLLGTIGIIYGAMASMVQTDIKKLVAYSSVSHLGFIVLGIFSFTEEAMSGAIVQMVNHGISTGALFLIIGMIYDRRHTREIKDFQGIAKVLPIFTVVFMITTFSSIGLPGLNGFVGEFLILLGSFSSDHVSPVYAVLGTTGVIIAAVYMLWMFRRVMFGTLDKDENRSLTDLNARELGLMLPLIALMFYIGFHATPVLKEIGKSSDRVVEKVISRTGSNFSQK
jgi:NADH-quinone oxidoreductase subunit M